MFKLQAQLLHSCLLRTCFQSSLEKMLRKVVSIDQKPGFFINSGLGFNLIFFMISGLYRFRLHGPILPVDLPPIVS